ncbi:hypothetical protein D9619_013585 [Psilocybe cf. subviscida]|uniref:C2H2-type domain-containing protein n=1 Tax=Psilocybe cf. subviscida TaxID=2480587 RepID=A0A8H5EQW6_9AGAR|nr:hypothetical protein D9619_013585 [Psilocybe cf. subviscida]
MCAFVVVVLLFLAPPPQILPAIRLVPSGSSAGSLSLATLSLSTSPPSGHNHTQSLGQAAYAHPPVAIKPRPSQGIPIISASAPNGVSILAKGEEDSAVADDAEEEQNDRRGSAPISVGGGKAKKRGVDYICESCSKIYRHPNCLNKHRWEHTRQWREASKFVLSKHQQVQLLEAAAILSYMGTPSTSLPEDRSEWPSFLSGGSLPKVDPVTGALSTAGNPGSASSDRNIHMATSAPYGAPLGHGHYASSMNVPRTTTTYALQPHPISSSVPNVSSGAGPRLHDYSLPAVGAVTKVTQVRPGLLGVPTPAPANGHTIIGGNGVSAAAGGWSLPNSSMRSASYGAGPASHSSRSRSGSRSRSRSGSGSRSDESVEIDIDVEGDDDARDNVAIAKSTPSSYTGYPGYPTMAPGGLSHSPGYGYGAGAGGYGTSGHVTGYGFGGHSFGRRGMGMKREEDEMSVGFSVREEDEDEEEELTAAPYPAKTQFDNKWNGLEMEMEMDMD